MISGIEQKLLKAVDPERAVKLAQELVRIPSLTGREGLRITKSIAEQLALPGVQQTVHKTSEDRASILCEYSRGSSGPRFLFEGHLDTKHLEGMLISPFLGEIRSNKLFGRGASDMKSGLAAMIVAFQTLIRSGIELPGSLALVSEVGEEGGGWAAPKLAKLGWYKANAAVIGEPTSLNVEIGSRGWLFGRVRIVGKSTHSGTAASGVNAIQKMAGVIKAFYDLPYLRSSIPLWGASSMNVYHVTGGGRVGSVADECIIHFDSRITDATTPDEAKVQIANRLEAMEREDPQLSFDWEFFEQSINKRLPTSINRDHPVVRTALECCEDVCGRSQLGTSAGYTILDLLLQQGTPSIILGPGHLEQAHAAVEWVDIDQVKQAARIYTLLAYRVLHSNVGGYIPDENLLERE